MTRYNFDELTDYDFESLVHDLLEREFNVPLEIFTPGPDNGIDLRFLAPPVPGSGTGPGYSGTLVVQCKRWKSDAAVQLLSHFKTKEAARVTSLAPDRYVLATAANLTPKRKDDLVALLRPWCQSTADILGRDDIVALIRRHPDVERQHIKLWLTSETVLSAVLNAGIHRRSQDVHDRLPHQLRLWAPNGSLTRAEKVLAEHSVCLLVGPPGIGKTMLADVLVALHCEQEYEPIVISEDILEGDDAWTHDKQIFYYDDFLGHISAGELELRKNEGSRLAAFVDRVRRTPGKRLLLTTREYILREAQSRYEPIDTSSTLDIAQCMVSLRDYTPPIRAKILYNHLFYSSLPYDVRIALLDDRAYRRVIQHRNFSPRVIQHAIDLTDVKNLPARGFVQKLFEALDNPAGIWARIYENLPKLIRDVLLAVATLPSPVLLQDLEVAARSLVSADAGADRSWFKNALRTLEGTFLKIDVASSARWHQPTPHARVVRVHDPSVMDFLRTRFTDGDADVDTILSRAVFFEQCARVLDLLRAGSTPIKSATLTSVAQRAVELLQTEPAQLIRVETGGFGAYEEWRRYDLDLAVRTQFIARVSVTAKTEDSSSAVRQALSVVRESIAEGSWDPVSAVRLVGELQSGVSLATEAQSLGQDIYDALALDHSSVQAFDALVELADLAPDLFSVSDRTLDHWREDFLGFLPDEIGSLTSDPDNAEWVDDEIGTLRKIADRLGADIDDHLFELEEFVSEHRREYDDDSDYRGSYASDTHDGDADIDAMFDSLRDRP